MKTTTAFRSEGQWHGPQPGWLVIPGIIKGGSTTQKNPTISLICETLRILGPSYRGVWTCIAGVRVLKIAIFEGSGFLGNKNSLKQKHCSFWGPTPICTVSKKKTLGCLFFLKKGLDRWKSVKNTTDREEIRSYTINTKSYIHPKFNIAPKKLPSPKASSLPAIIFQRPFETSWMYLSYT